MTPAYTLQIAIYAAIIGFGLFGYMHRLSRDFDRKWGKDKPSEPDA